MYSRGVREVQASLDQIAQQRTHHRGVLGRALAHAQHRFAPVAANPKGYDHLPVLERRAVDQHGAQPQLAQRPLHQLLHLLPAGLDEVLAHRRLLDPVGVLKSFTTAP